jgi:hypothetical protein
VVDVRLGDRQPGTEIAVALRGNGRHRFQLPRHLGGRAPNLGQIAGIPLIVDPTPVEPVSFPAGSEHRVPEAKIGAALADLTRLLMYRKLCGARDIERARRVASETGVMLESALIDLGLVSERHLAEAFATLLTIPLMSKARIPKAAIFVTELKPTFLRKSRCLPIAVEGDHLVIALANPLDDFTKSAVASAVGMPVAIEVAVPIELEKALDDLYPDSIPITDLDDTGETGADSATDADTQRLIFASGTVTTASCTKSNRFRSQTQRRSYRGSKSCRNWTSPNVGCRRTAALNSGSAARTLTSAFRRSRRSTAKLSCYASSIAPL